MEKFMKKIWKKNDGFTLVELIVVIAILGILAAVAVPAYSGYMTKAKDAAVMTELDAVKTAAFAIKATDTTSNGDVTSIEVVSTGAIKINNVTCDSLEPYYTISDLTSKLAGTSYKDGATWNGSTWQPK